VILIFIGRSRESTSSSWCGGSKRIGGCLGIDMIEKFYRVLEISVRMGTVYWIN